MTAHTKVLNISHNLDHIHYLALTLFQQLTPLYFKIQCFSVCDFLKGMNTNSNAHPFFKHRLHGNRVWQTHFSHNRLIFTVVLPQLHWYNAGTQIKSMTPKIHDNKSTAFMWNRYVDSSSCAPFLRCWHKMWWHIILNVGNVWAAW